MSDENSTKLATILRDTGDELTPAVEPGTQVIGWINPVDNSFWYNHPLTDEEWVTLEGDYEVIA
jgi:hypothetical protein